MKNDISKLPRWARVEIERLRANTAGLEARLAAAIGTMPTKIEVDPWRQFEAGTPCLFLHDRATVHFTLPSGEVDVRIRGERLEIMGISSGGREFIVCPSVSNVIHVLYADLRDKQ